MGNSKKVDYYNKRIKEAEAEVAKLLPITFYACLDCCKKFKFNACKAKRVHYKLSFVI